jgi:hypothetical protein
MANKYADRAFISINGTPVADVQSSSMKRNKNAKPVPSMTRDGFNAGFTQGNEDIDVTLQIAVRNKDPRPKFDSIDYEENDVSITYVVGADQYIATGVFLKDSDDNAGGVGDEVKSSFNFGALRLTDAVGNGVLFSIDL